MRFRYSNFRADAVLPQFMRLTWSVSTQETGCEPGIFITHYILAQVADAAPPVYANGMAQFTLRRDPNTVEDGTYMCDSQWDTLTPTF